MICARSEATFSVEIEGTDFQVTIGTDDLCEFEGRAGLYFFSDVFCSSMKVYIDNPESFRKLGRWFLNVADSLDSVKKTNLL